MKATSIQIGNSYEVSVGRGTSIVKVVDINRKSGAWICETQTGKDITISDAKRFIKAISDKAGKGKKKSPGLSSEHDAETLPKIGTAVKEKRIPVDPKEFEHLVKELKDSGVYLKAAQNAFKYGLIDQKKLDAAKESYDAAITNLRTAGGKTGAGGRCLGQMSGLEAAYKVLSETGKAMNGRQICEMALDNGYWEPQGSTPEATIVSAILTEMKKKGEESRFERVGRGLFAAKK
ncbi:MAG: winged helix-turn-helix domain-containing protein [Thermoguttaceae bacterium]